MKVLFIEFGYSCYSVFEPLFTNPNELSWVPSDYQRNKSRKIIALDHAIKLHEDMQYSRIYTKYEYGLN